VTDLPVRANTSHNVNVLGRYLTNAVKATGVAAGRLRNWLGFMVVAGMLDQSRDSVDGRPLFLIKGGVAIELRVGGLARATRDIDMALRTAIGDLEEHLDPSLRRGFGDFTATRTEIEGIGNTGPRRCQVKIQYRGRPVVSVPVEFAATEASMADDIDHVVPEPLNHLGSDGPDTVPCVAIKWQIAQKIHACTHHHPDRANDRLRDLLDLQLLAALVDTDDWAPLRAACIEVFDGRATHQWPPRLVVPDAWVDGYSTLAADTGFHIADVHVAAVQVQSLIDGIDVGEPAPATVD